MIACQPGSIDGESPRVCRAQSMSPSRRRILRMQSVHFDPYAALLQGARAKGCLTCEHWHGERTESGHVVCARELPWRYIKGTPHPCAYWMRATGGDDE